MAFLRELITLIGFEVDVAGFSKGEKAFAELVGIAKGTLNAIRDLTSSTAEFSIEVGNMAIITGMGTDEIQKLKIAADQSGLSMDAMQRKTVMLLRRAQDAVDGSKAWSKAFHAAGISTAELKDNIGSTTDLIALVAQRILNGETAAKRARDAFKLFGITGAQAIPMLQMLSKTMGDLSNRQEEFRFLTDDQIAASRELKFEQTQLGAIWDGITRQLGAELTPAMLDAIRQTREFIDAHKDLINNGLKTLGEWFDKTKDKAFEFIGYIDKNKHSVIAFATALTATLIPALILAQPELAATGLAMLTAFGEVVAYGAAFLVIAGAISDIYDYSRGVDSVMGRLHNKIKEMNDEAARGKDIGFFGHFFTGMMKDFDLVNDAVVKVVLKVLDLKGQLELFFQWLGGEHMKVGTPESIRNMLHPRALSPAVTEDILGTPFQFTPKTSDEWQSKAPPVGAASKGPPQFWRQPEAPPVIPPEIHLTIFGSKMTDEELKRVAQQELHDAVLKAMNEVKSTQEK